MKNIDQEQYNELAYYTLAHSDPAFIHQCIVDAYTAQHADGTTKPIALAFALVGLYLHVEKGFTGKQVQQTHVQMAKRKRRWPTFDLPEQRGTVTISDVLNVPPSSQRDVRIDEWCVSVWSAYTSSREQVIDLVRTVLGWAL